MLARFPTIGMVVLIDDLKMPGGVPTLRMQLRFEGP